MPLSPFVYKEENKDLSIEELEKKYYEMMEFYQFESKEKQIEFELENYLSQYVCANYDNEIEALKELLKEKTGKTYEIKHKKYDITLLDYINYMAKGEKNVIKSLKKFFRKLPFIHKLYKKYFLMNLYQDTESFEEFIKEISQNKNCKKIFEKYKKIAEEYASMHNMVG